MMGEYTIFAFICFILAALGLSVVKDLFGPGQKPPPENNRSGADILPPLPMIQTSPPAAGYQPPQNNPYPAQPVNGQYHPQLDPATVIYMMHLFNQGKGERKQ